MYDLKKQEQKHDMKIEKVSNIIHHSSPISSFL